MTDKDIKPIPKYITEKIRRIDTKVYPAQNAFLRFYAYLTVWKKELVKVTVAVKNYRRKWYIKQVAVHGLRSAKCYVKDMEYCGFVGMGYRVGWYEQGIQNYQKWFESELWSNADNKYYDPWAMVVNREIIAKFPEYKYSGYMEYQGKDLLSYLRLYERYPQTEYLVKLGLHGFVESKTILKQIAKDKRFCKWLIKQRSIQGINYCYACTLLKAYKSGQPTSKVQKYEKRRKSFSHDKVFKPLQEQFKGKILERYFDYTEEKNISDRTYLDYLTACNYLGLDMSLDKNRFPHDFQRWHDIRIDEYKSKKALADKKEREELYKQFATVAEKYLPLEYDKQNACVVIIARSPADLTREGDILHHCVGSINYDMKVVREESLIFFVRDATKPDTPFVTVEYSPKAKKVLQCYGDCNSRPNETIMDFINSKWLPYANKTIKKLKAA